VGAAVGEFAVGERVFGLRTGSNAEFVCVRQEAPIGRMPANMTFEEAAAVCDGACTALSFLRQVGLREGQKLLVYGASGSIGTAAVQLAKQLGAHVTAVCNTKNVDIVRSLGAEKVIDYLEEDFTKNGETYDVVLDAVGKRSPRRCRRSLTPDGTYVTAGSSDTGSMWQPLILHVVTRVVGKRTVTLGRVRYAKKDVAFVAELLEAGAYRAVIDRKYPLEEVIEATRYVETGQKTGNVVLTVSVDRTT
jgi:NADPH:quinone reductase-like Zn-dependent oxidoreductase